MEYLLYILIAVILMSVQHFLSIRKNPLFGAVLPILVIPFSVWVFTSRSLPLSFKTLFPFAGLIIVLFGIWAEGRERLRKKQKKELEKMKAKDMGE